MSNRPAANIEVLDRLAAHANVGSCARLHIARADLLRRLDRRSDAASAYRRVLTLDLNEAERAFIRRPVADLAG